MAGSIEQLKNKTVFGIIWSLVSSFGTLAITFLSNIILARLLTPDDFGCIGILAVFVALAGILIDGGLGVALIQKKNPTSLDYSTVYTFNLVLSLFFYAVIFVIAPFIADFYNIPILKSILRVQGIILLINPFRIVQYNILIKTLRFKKLAEYEIASALIGTTVGILMAFNNFGVWSLVFANIINSLVFTVTINCVRGHWHSRIQFNLIAFKSLFSFGGLILLSNMIDTLYNNINNIIIGKMFSATQLGYFTQADKLKTIPVNSVSKAINGVFFPVFSEFQDDRKRLGHILRQNIVTLSYLSFPIMTALIITASPLINFIYSDKWNNSVPFFELLCFTGMIFPINMLNLNIIKSLGKGGKYLIMQICQLVLGVSAVGIGAAWGIMGLTIGFVFSAYMYFVFISMINYRVVGVGLFSQLFAIVGNVLLSFVWGGILYSIKNNITTGIMLLDIIFPVLIYLSGYIITSYLFKMNGFNNILAIVRNHK